MTRTILFLFLATLAVDGGPLYTVVGLGGYGGNSSVAVAVNSSGVAAGSARTITGVDVALRHAGSGMETLSGGAVADDINAAGVVVGTRNGSAVVWQGGVATEVLPGSQSWGLGINDAGDVAGSYVSGSQSYSFVRHADGSLTTLATPGTFSAAYDINSYGAVAGSWGTGGGVFRAYSWSAGAGLNALGTLGGLSSWGQAINDNGWVVGASQTASGYLHGFIYDGSAMRDLGTLGGALSSAYDINASGTVVGYCTDALGRRRAFVWANGFLMDLNDLLGGEAGWTLEEAYGINAQGQIVGTGLYQGNAAAFLLNPVTPPQLSLSSLSIETPAAVPEPWSLAMVGAGLTLVACLRRKVRTV